MIATCHSLHQDALVARTQASPARYIHTHHPNYVSDFKQTIIFVHE